MSIPAPTPGPGPDSDASSDMAPEARAKRARALAEEANRLREAGAHDDAVARYTEALALWRGLGERAEAATTLVGLAWVHHVAGRDPAALAILAEARVAFAELGLLAAEGTAWLRSGDIQADAGDAEAALAAYHEARRCFGSAGDRPAETEAMGRMASELWELGRADEAVALHQAAAALHAAAGDPAAAAASWLQSAAGLAMMGKMDAAEAAVDQAAELYEAAGRPSGRSLAESRRARLLWRRGRRAEAEAALGRAAETLRAAGLDSNDAGESATLLDQQRARLRAGVFPEAVRGTILPAEEVEALIQNTVAVMTVMPEQRPAWRTRMVNARADAVARGAGWQVEVDLFAAVLALVDGQLAAATLPPEHPYAPTLAAIRTGIAGGGPKELPVAREVLAAVREFVATPDWPAARRLVEERHEVLFRPEADELFERNIAAATANGDTRGARVLALHRDVLRVCREQGIEAGFAWLRQVLADADARAEAAEEVPEALSADFAGRFVAAILGAPAEKLALFSYLQGLAAFDPGVAELAAALQAAVLAGDMANHGERLTGVHARYWRRLAEALARASDSEL